MTGKIWIFGAAAALGLAACSPSTPETAAATETTETAATPSTTTETAAEKPAEVTGETVSASTEATPETETAPAGTETGDVATRKPKDGEEVAVLETAQGRIILMFFPDKAPNHVKRFKEAVTEGIYTGTYFHRVIPGFMIQGGDPNTKNSDKGDDGMGGYGSFLKAEFNDVKHVRGILSAARTQDPNSAQSQFFIVQGKADFLDGQYTAYGKVVSGMEAVDKIVNLPRGQGDNPNKSDDARIKSAKIVKWPVK